MGRPGAGSAVGLGGGGGPLVITWVPVGGMGRVGALAPASPGETEVLAALLAGARVCLERKALEYRLYRRTAPPSIYRRCLSLERQLREMGICVAGTGGR